MSLIHYVSLFYGGRGGAFIVETKQGLDAFVEVGLKSFSLALVYIYKNNQYHCTIYSPSLHIWMRNANQSNLEVFDVYKMS